MLEWAIQVMNFHASRKSVLEIEFQGEDGTGLGPTLEFYALVAAELQRKDLCMWLCDDMQDMNRYIEFDKCIYGVNTSYDYDACLILPDMSSHLLLMTPRPDLRDTMCRDPAACSWLLWFKTLVLVTRRVDCLSSLESSLQKCYKTVD